MADEAWEPVPDYERFWTPFDERYAFRPNPSRSPPPGITEPSDSVTFSLAPIYSRVPSVTEDLINDAVLTAFLQVFDERERLIVLDWQHTSYWFRPHVHASTETEWQVTPVPDGDYYSFLSEDMWSGTFGHPWEGTICVFGRELVDALAPTLSTLLPIIRRGGVAPGPAS